MTDIRDLEECEHRLRRAQIASDVAELDRLVHPDLQFVGPDGLSYGKADDLEYHRSGKMKVESAEAESLEMEIVDGDGVTVLVVHMLASSTAKHLTHGFATAEPGAIRRQVGKRAGNGDRYRIAPPKGPLS